MLKPVEVKAWKALAFVALISGASVVIYPTPLQVARWHEREGDFEAALAAYRVAVDSRDKDERTRLRLCEILARQGLFEEAEEQLLKQVYEGTSPIYPESDPGAPALVLAKLHRDRMQPQQALDVAELALQYHADDLALITQLAQQRYWRKSYEDVRVLLGEARARGLKLSREMILLLALAHERAGDAAAAVALREELLEAVAPSEAEVRHLVALYQILGQEQRELATLRRLTDLYPNAHYGLWLADRLVAAQRFDEARALYAELAARSPDRQDLARTVVQLALEHGAEGADQAAGAYLARWPDDVATRSWWAARLSEEGRSAEARREHRIVVGDIPSNTPDPRMLRLRATSLTALDRRAEALGEWRALLVRQSDDRVALVEVARYELDEDDVDGAESRVERLETLAPQEEDTRKLRARVDHARGRHPEVVRNLRRLGAGGTRGGEMDSLYADSLLETGRWREALPLRRRLARGAEELWELHRLDHRYRSHADVEARTTDGPLSESSQRLRGSLSHHLHERWRVEAGWLEQSYRQKAEGPYPAVDRRAEGQDLRLEFVPRARWLLASQVASVQLHGRRFAPLLLEGSWARPDLGWRALLGWRELADNPADLTAFAAQGSRLEGEAWWKPAPSWTTRLGARRRTLELRSPPPVLPSGELGDELEAWGALERALYEAPRTFISTAYRYGQLDLAARDPAVFAVVPLLNAQRQHGLSLYGYQRLWRYTELEGSLGWGLDTVRDTDFVSTGFHLAQHLRDRLRLKVGFETGDEARAIGGGAIQALTLGCTWLF